MTSTNSTVLNPFVATFINLAAASVFNAYRKDLSRKEREENAGPFGHRLREHIVRDFRMLCSLATVEEIAEADPELGEAAKMVRGGFGAWVEQYWYGATPEERAKEEAYEPLTQERYDTHIYYQICESDTYGAWHDAVDDFNSARPLFGQGI
jgi:hypothetical protein